MNEENIKNIIQKYKAGETSLAEEKMLFDSVPASEEQLKTLGTFVKKNTISVPENLNDKLWDAFDEKTKKPNKFKLRLFSAAASIALMFSVVFYNSSKNELSESEKEALLNEAISMFENASKTKQNQKVILENELVIVYTETE
ncbi:MAG: hypothetical protein AB8B78_06205 [Polaribacter sp.]